MTVAAHIPDVVLVCAIGATLLVPIVWRVRHGVFDPFEPLVIFAAAYAVMFVLRPMAMILAGDYSYEAPLSVTDVGPGFRRMLILALLGTAGFVVGYFVRDARSGDVPKTSESRAAESSLPPRPLDRHTAVLVASTTALLCVVAGILFVAGGGSTSTLTTLLHGRTAAFDSAIREGSFYPWTMMLMLVPAALILLSVVLDHPSRITLGLFLVVTGLVLVRAVPSGDRVMLLVFCGGLFVFLYLRRSSRPSLVTIAVLACGALLLSTFLSDLRGRDSRNETVGQTVTSVVQRPWTSLDRLATGPDSEMAPALAIAVQAIPHDLHYTYGKTIFGDLLVRPIPRALWSDKPDPPRNKLLAHLWPRESNRGSINAEFSILAPLYWDFGIPGAIVGMILFGAGARTLYENFIARNRSISGYLFYAVAFWLVVVGLRNGPVDTLITSVFVLGPLATLYALDARRASRRSTACVLAGQV